MRPKVVRVRPRSVHGSRCRGCALVQAQRPVARPSAALALDGLVRVHPLAGTKSCSEYKRSSDPVTGDRGNVPFMTVQVNFSNGDGGISETKYYRDLEGRRYRYEVHPSGALLIWKTVDGPAEAVEISYGPGVWHSAEGDREARMHG